MRTTAILTLVLALAAIDPAVAQNPGIMLTADDYAAAERLLATHTRPLVVHDDVQANWISDDRMWYRNTIIGGAEFVLVDARTGTRRRAFDHNRLASAITAASGDTVDALSLPFNTFELGDDGRSITFSTRRGSYDCGIRRYTCTFTERTNQRDSGGPQSGFRRRTDSPSPDGSLTAFIRENNLWVRDTESGEERRLTTDGVEDFGYGTNNAGWTRSDAPVVKWSPDGRKIATFQHDGRGVGMMHLVSTDVGHPRLESWKYPLPGDSLIFRIERVVIDVETGDLVRLKMPADQHRSAITDHVAYRGEWADVEWSADASRLFFVSSSRDHKQAILREADPETGDVREILEEVVDTFYESGARSVSWTVLEGTDEVIWYSQRDDWGHLYLYDLTTGDLEHQITSGSWNVIDVLRVDEEERRIVFMGNERETGDPYFQYLYSINLDGSDLQLLTPETGNHSVSFSPSHGYFVDTYSTPVEPPVSVLREADGGVVVELEAADISQLVAYGWRPPIPFSTKARDGETDLHGLMYRPTHFDSTQSYPVVNYLYPGPQAGSVGSRSFTPSRGDKQSLAELGFIVVEVDAMGTPLRSKSFHEAYYGNMGDNGIPDQIAMIRQLAERHAYMDVDRVGIYGHSGGGFASTAAILRYPDFYKVAVSQAGNHDNATYEDDWGEKWHGLLEHYPDGTTNYDKQANHLLAGNLEGKLLLAHGSMDSNVPPNNTMLVVDKLIEANKDFDLIIFPNRGHGFGSEPYMMRRRWDYFVRHLMGAEPPVEYEFGQREFNAAAM